MSKPIYRHTVTINSVATEVLPIYEGSLGIQIDREGGQVFFRLKLSGPLQFVRTEFDLLNAVGMNDTVYYAIELFTGSWVSVYTGYWNRTDMLVDEDNKIIEVTPNAYDLYDEILAGLDREFNLPQMEIPVTPVKYHRSPLVQVYVRGSNYITNYIGGTYWEQEVTPEGDGYVLENDYKFATPGQILMYIPGDSSVLDPDVSGEYVYNGTGDNYLRDDGAFEIRLNPSVGGGSFQWEIVEKPSDTAVYRKPVDALLTMPYCFEPAPDNFASLTTASECQVYEIVTYSRILCNAATFDGAGTFDMPSPDIAPENPNYTKVAQYAVDSYIGGTDHQTAPTIYGQFKEDALHFAGEYFVKPGPPSGVTEIYPVSGSDWVDFSAWLYIEDTLKVLLEAESEELLLRHAYKLADILAAMLAELEPGAGHEETSDYSDFFYSASNAVRGSRKYPIFAPKTNVKAGEYDRPATRAILKLGELLAFLADFYQVFWYVDTSDRLRLEHIRFFRNGGSYTAEVLGADLTVAVEPKFEKAWGYRSTKYNYDRASLPRQIRWRWMDKQSPRFDGYPLEFVNPFVDKAGYEERVFSQFSADLEFIQAQPGLISDDGFVFLEAELDGSDYIIPYITQAGAPGEEYYLQNGYASLLYAVLTYWLDDLPCEDIIANTEAGTALSVKRSKIQEVEFPGDTSIDPMQLIRTSIGDGRIRSLELNLHSRTYKIVIEHDIP